jgi:hypothetical protein
MIHRYINWRNNYAYTNDSAASSTGLTVTDVTPESPDVNDYVEIMDGTAAHLQNGAWSA